MNNIVYEIISHPKYKYRLMADFIVDLQDKFPKDFNLRFLYGKGKRLTIRKGYSWDGPSGPAIDTVDFMRPSLVHDALYQLMDEKILPGSFRRKADFILFKLYRKEFVSNPGKGIIVRLANGMRWIVHNTRAVYIYTAVRLGGWTHRLT